MPIHAMEDGDLKVRGGQRLGKKADMRLSLT